MKCEQEIGGDVSGELAGRDIIHNHGPVIHQTAGRDIVNNHHIERVDRMEISGPAHFHIPAVVRVRERYDYSAGVGPEHINDEQKARLRELVNEIVALETAIKRAPKRHGAIWSALTAKFKVPSYHRLKAADFAQTEAYLIAWRARLRRTEEAARKDPDWRNSRYRYIYGAAKEIGRDGEIPQLLVDRYSGRSLKELSDLELEAVYRIIAQWKKQARQHGAV